MIYNLTKKRTRLSVTLWEYNDINIKAARDNGYEVIQWSVDSLDWQEQGVEAVVDRVVKHSSGLSFFSIIMPNILGSAPIILKN